MMEESITYDEGPVREVGEKGGARRRWPPQEEDLVVPGDIQEGTKLAHRISTTDTVAGMYALLLLSLGIAFPVSEYTSPSNETHHRDALDTGFELYVFVLSCIFQVYIAVKTRLFLIKQKSSSEDSEDDKTKNNTMGLKGNVYVISDDVGGSTVNVGQKSVDYVVRDVPWHLWHKVAPPVYHTKQGFNIFTRIGILIFGASALAVEICRLVDYGQDVLNKCRYDAKLALIIIRMIFIIIQSLYLFIHHRIVFNFQHPLIKFALLHIISANLITWIKTVARESVETYALLDNVAPSLSQHMNNSSNYHHEPSLAESLCVSLESNEYRASNYLAPLVIEYCVLAAAIVYRQYCLLGPKTYLNPPKPNIWELNQDAPTGRWRLNIGLAIGLPLFLATLGLTIWNMVLADQQMKDQYVMMTQGRITTACDLTWNILIIIGLFPAFYSVNKLRYEHRSLQTIEHILLTMLGGTFLFLGFITVASFMKVTSPGLDGFTAKSGIPGCLINFLQSVAMFVFVVDVYRRQVSDVKQPHGEGAVTFLIFANISMWLVSSFQWKYSFGSILFYKTFGRLAWVLIVNSTLPLAMFFRFIVCIVLMDVIRDTYGHRLSKIKCLDRFK